MIPIQNYTKSEAFLRVLLQGPPGSGKTTLACQFPKAYVVDMDVNLAGPLRFLSKRSLALPVGYDRLDIDESGKLIAMPQRYTRLDVCLQRAQMEPSVETIVLDSATGFTDILMAETLRRQPDTASAAHSLKRWGFFHEYGKQFLSIIAQIRKHVVFIAHERVEKDEVEQTLKYRVSWPGQLGDKLGAFFTDVWRCEVHNSGGLDPKYKWLVRTTPDLRYDLKNGFEFKPLFEFTWDQVAERLKDGNINTVAGSAAVDLMTLQTV